jgi:hypothetical protein
VLFKLGADLLDVHFALGVVNLKDDDGLGTDAVLVFLKVSN